MDYSDSEISGNKYHFLSNMTVPSVVMKMPRHAKAKKSKRGLSQNQEAIRSENLDGHYFSVALIYHESKTLGGSMVL